MFSKVTIKALGFLALLFLVSCGPRTEKLDEAVIYNGSQFKLKLVRYYENLPTHYKGEVYSVQCASAQTTDSPGSKMQEAGWVTLGNGSAIGFKNAGELVERQRWKYLTVDDQTLVWAGNGFNISFDACGHFQGWYPTSLPAELIIPVEKPDYCEPKGDTDCRLYEFQGDREPSYTQIQVESKTGYISFVVQSSAFKNPNGFKVQSVDYGKTWQAETLK
ncbi:MAG TPA: hypothetical protein VFX02_08635 [Gammaproteobacteria bacterium]|nr:hypothetical protein [Gammaproteobacteria bacterium]